MEKNPRRGRGRGRGQSPSVLNNSLEQPRNPGSQRPQVSRPTVQQPTSRPPGCGGSVTRKQVPDQGQKNTSEIDQQVTDGVKNLSTGHDFIPIGRGVVRGRREIEYFRAPRPESSLISKQGNSGNSIKLLTNYFPITSYTNWTLYQYRVNFNPVQDKHIVQRGLVHAHVKKLGPYIFDGTMLFSSTKYDDTFELVSKRNYDDQIVTITISFSRELKTNDYAYIQFFNLLLKSCIRGLKLNLIGRNFFDMEARINIDKHRLQILPGYETTIGMFDSGLMLRSEISTKIMRKDTVLDFYRECMRGENGLIRFKEGVIGTIVLTTYNNQTYKINDVDDEANVTSTFLKKDGSRMSYLQYYKEKWTLTVREPRQPMLISKKKKNFVDREEELIYLVPELCTMTGLTDHMRSNFSLMRDLAVHTQVDPRERVSRYNNFMTRLQTTPKCMEIFNTWNMRLGTGLVELSGRVLPPESIHCNIVSKKYEGGIQANWTNHLRDLPMFTCASIKQQWHIICPSKLQISSVQKFVNELRVVGQKMNFMLPVPNIVSLPTDNLRVYVTEIDKICNGYNPPLIMCVLLNNRVDLYTAIKKSLCVTRAIPSQVVLAKHIERLNMSVSTKIAIQLNAKLGGAPWRIVIPSKGMMIVGFDVCHDKRRNKSYGALVATLNDSHTSYYSNVQVHNSGEEISNHFGAVIVSAVQRYRKKNNGALPVSIVVYRDGVGDGQLSYVQKTEVNSIKAMCKQAFEKVPALAFVIVKKRISTRFFSQLSQGLQNPPPGTVIDSVVTDPSMYDFYLISQNTRFGTVTPTHYNVIEDTLENWSPDRMQRLTFKLTHMYFNWSGTVRVPAPCQLAHKLAFLSGQVGVPNVGLDELLFFL